jgi:hypothetical protein
MEWLNKLKDYAPSIASAILTGGATLPQLAYKAISDATGVDVKSMAQAQTAIESADPGQLLVLKQADYGFKLKMKKLDNELTATELADVQDAREQHKHSIMPAAITIALTLIVGGAGYMIMTTAIPDGNKEIAYMLFGQVTALWGASVTYWVGTTRSSAEKDRR